MRHRSRFRPECLRHAGTFRTQRFENPTEKNVSSAREIAASGRSSALSDDTPACRKPAKELGEMFIDVHCQRKTCCWTKENFQLNVIDILARQG